MHWFANWVMFWTVVFAMSGTLLLARWNRRLRLQLRDAEIRVSEIRAELCLYGWPAATTKIEFMQGISPQHLRQEWNGSGLHLFRPDEVDASIFLDVDDPSLDSGHTRRDKNLVLLLRATLSEWEAAANSVPARKKYRPPSAEVERLLARLEREPSP